MRNNSHIALVNCLDYNGHKNVLFIMEKSDFRYNTNNYVHQKDGEKVGNRFRAEDGTIYQVFSDWSVRQL